jgi:integrase
MSRSPTNRSDRRHAQVVFRMGRAGIACGVDPHLEGAYFLCEPGRDRSEANAYLYARHTREFAKRRRQEAPAWMGRGRKLRPKDRSLRVHAGDLSRGIRWLESRNLSILNVTEENLDELGEDLEHQKLESGTIGAIQSSIMYCAQWAVWEGKRLPLEITTMPISGHQGVSNAVVRKQRRARPIEYIDPETAHAICSAIVDPAYRIAVRLGFGSGLRPFESGVIEDGDMPYRSNGSPLRRDTFSVVGKGDKRRYPEIDPALLDDINHYRFDVRSARARKFRERHGTEPTHLLLNGKFGEPISYHGLYAAFSKACGIVGVRARLHWARHAYACDHMAKVVIDRLKAVLRAGGTVGQSDIDALMTVAQVELMTLMGHAQIDTTSIYLTTVRHAITHALNSMGAEL